LSYSLSYILEKMEEVEALSRELRRHWTTFEGLEALNNSHGMLSASPEINNIVMLTAETFRKLRSSSADLAVELERLTISSSIPSQVGWSR